MRFITAIYTASRNAAQRALNCRDAAEKKYVSDGGVPSGWRQGEIKKRSEVLMRFGALLLG